MLLIKGLEWQVQKAAWAIDESTSEPTNCARGFLLRKPFVKFIGEKWNCSGALPGQCQPPVRVSGCFSSHHICSSTFQVIKLAYSLIFNVRISASKEISLLVCILWQLGEAGNMLDISSGKLRTQESFFFRKQIVSFRFDVKYPEGCLLFPSLPSMKHREGATNLSWDSS